MACYSGTLSGCARLFPVLLVGGLAHDVGQEHRPQKKSREGGSKWTPVDSVAHNKEHKMANRVGRIELLLVR